MLLREANHRKTQIVVKGGHTANRAQVTSAKAAWRASFATYSVGVLERHADRVDACGSVEVPAQPHRARLRYRPSISMLAERGINGLAPELDLVWGACGRQLTHMTHLLWITPVEVDIG